MPPLSKLEAPNGIGDIMEDLTRAILVAQPNDIYEFAVKHFEELIAIREAAQGSGISPSSTAESTNKAPDPAEVPVTSPEPHPSTSQDNASPHPPLGKNLSAEGPHEKPLSEDTSYGVEATAISQLAASTGTVAILSSTAQTPTKELKSGDVSTEDITIDNADETLIVEEIEDVVEETTKTDVLPEESQGKNEKSPDVEEPSSIEASPDAEMTKDSRPESSLSDIQVVPTITETLVPNAELSPTDEADPSTRSSPDGADSGAPSTDFSGRTEITKSTDISAEERGEQSKVVADENKEPESTSTMTIENDISSERMKTNSLSDVSFSDLDEKEGSVAMAEHQPRVVGAVERTGEPSGESGNQSEAEQKLIEDSTSESSQQITKEESTSDITTENQQDSKPQGDEEPLISSPADDPSLDDDDDDDDVFSKKNAAALKIQSSFRGFKVRKSRSTVEGDIKGDETDEKSDLSDPKLTESEIEDVKEQVEGIIKEAEDTTDSLRNTPDIDEHAGPEDEFPAPPDAALLNQLRRDESRDRDKDTLSLNIERVPYPDGDTQQTEPLSDATLESDQKPTPPDQDDNTTAELARMTADEDLPAPDFELLESSCTDDLHTEVVTDKGAGSESHNSTEGDVTIEEDSDELKQLQKPQECDEIRGDEQIQSKPELDVNEAATKIQANVRGFLTRKQVDRVTNDEVASVGSDEKAEVAPLESSEPSEEPVDVKDSVPKEDSEGPGEGTLAELIEFSTEEGLPTSPGQQISEKTEQQTDESSSTAEGSLSENAEKLPENQSEENASDKDDLETLQPQSLTSEINDNLDSSSQELLRDSDNSESGVDDKASSRIDSVSQDTTSSQNTVEEQPPRSLTSSADDAKQDTATLQQSAAADAKSIAEENKVLETQTPTPSCVESTSENPGVEEKTDEKEEDKGESAEVIPAASESSHNEPESHISSPVPIVNSEESGPLVTDEVVSGENKGTEVCSESQSSAECATDAKSASPQLSQEIKPSNEVDSQVHDIKDEHQNGGDANSTIASPAPSAQPEAPLSSTINGSEPTEHANDEDLLNLSATKIQANVRGYLTRKKQTTN